MQTLQDQYAALLKRTHAASEAMKQVERLTPKVKVKEAEIAALEASVVTCPEGQTKNGLAKRIETLKGSLGKLKEDMTTAEFDLTAILDLSVPYHVPHADAAIGTEGGESTAE
jgi:hypothetical protein